MTAAFMARSDSEDVDGFGNDKEEELDNDNEQEIDESDADGEVDAEGDIDSEGDEETGSESEDESEENDEENEDEEVADDVENDEEEEEEEDMAPSPAGVVTTKTPVRRSLSPAFHRRSLLYSERRPFKSYTIETICALPHPVATHSLASSLCMTHLLTGSDDGYIRDYDVYTACNGKNFLSQPQRQHCGIQEGAIKAPVARMWGENPRQPVGLHDENPVGPSLSPVHSLLVHSDALWGLSGTAHGHINLFTIRHDPGRVVHALSGHNGPVSSMTMMHGEKGVLSAGWDGDVLEWDLNTGQIVRTYSHGHQLSTVAMRPLTVREPDSRVYRYQGAGASTLSGDNLNLQQGDRAGLPHPDQQNGNAEDTKSEASFHSLFDDEPELSKPEVKIEEHLALPSSGKPNGTIPGSKLPVQSGLVPPTKTATFPLLDPVTYNEYSSDIFLAASIDGQVVLWDRRAHDNARGGVGRLDMGDKCPPWCLSACWSCDGSEIYAGRRNGTIDMWDVRILGRGSRGTPRLLKSLRNPPSSGAVSAVVAFPDGNHIACASLDNIRLWNVAEAPEGDAGRRTTPAFKIIAGHHGGIVSQLLVDVGGRFMVSASGNRGWSGDSTRTVLVHEVKGII